MFFMKFFINRIATIAKELNVLCARDVFCSSASETLFYWKL